MAIGLVLASWISELPTQQCLYYCRFQHLLAMDVAAKIQKRNKCLVLHGNGP